MPDRRRDPVPDPLPGRGRSPAVQQPPRRRAGRADQEVEALAYDLPRCRWWPWPSRSTATAAPTPRPACCASAGLHRRDPRGRRRAAGAGRLHGPLRLRRLRARRRRDARGLDQGAPIASATSISAPPTPSVAFEEGRADGLRPDPTEVKHDAALPSRPGAPGRGTARRPSADRAAQGLRDSSATGWPWSRRSARSRPCCCTWPARCRGHPVLFLDTGMLFGQTLDYRKSWPPAWA
jgi:hypothetical protein